MKNDRCAFWGLTLVCGVAGGILRHLMITTGLDSSGLLEPGNAAHYGLWAVSVLFLLALALSLRRLGGCGTYSDNFPASKLCGSLAIAGGAVLIGESIRQILSGSRLVGLAGAAAGVCMILTGYCRAKGERPTPALHFIVCIFYILRLISSFRHWSADPQLQDYALQLLACVNLMLLSFHRASCDARIINRRRTVFWGLAAVYFCMASLSDETMPLLYAASGLWAAGSLCSLERLPEDDEKET